MSDETLVLSRAEIDDMLDAAAERGASKALEKVGLHDAEAVRDVAEIRGLLEAWRDTKTTVRRTVVKWAIGLVLAAIAAGVALKG